MYLEGTCTADTAAEALWRQPGISALVGLRAVVSTSIWVLLGGPRQIPFVVTGFEQHRQRGCLRHKRLQSIIAATSNLPIW